MLRQSHKSIYLNSTNLLPNIPVKQIQITYGDTHMSIWKGETQFYKKTEKLRNFEERKSLNIKTMYLVTNR